jgi:gluconate kinase
MQPSLLASQFAILEPLDDEELGAKVSVDLSPLEIVDRILADVGWLDGESESRREEAQ